MRSLPKVMHKVSYFCSPMVMMHVSLSLHFVLSDLGLSLRVFSVKHLLGLSQWCCCRIKQLNFGAKGVCFVLFYVVSFFDLLCVLLDLNALVFVCFVVLFHSHWPLLDLIHFYFVAALFLVFRIYPPCRLDLITLRSLATHHIVNIYRIKKDF